MQRDMQQEHQILSRAQRTEEQFRSLAAAQQRTDGALTALVGTVDEIIRSRRQ